MDKLLPSKYNQITEITDGDIAIYNPLSGAFDIADKPTLEAFQSGVPRNQTEKEYWLERGYFFKTKIDEKIYTAKRFQDFVDISTENQIQFMLVLSYGCNFNCPYCYQKGIDTKEIMSEEMLDAFLDYIVEYRKKQNKEVVVSLFGGEPLLMGTTQIARIKQLVKRLAVEKIGLSVVTNGYNLAEYIDILKKGDIKEIHISIDGDESEHNRRRQTKDGKDSFQKILAGMKLAQQADFPINIRMIIDRKSLPTIPKLAEELDREGFLDLPKTQFKTSLGRNYELINEYVSQADLYTIDGMYAEFVKMMLKYPLLKKLHTPSFFGITKVVESGEMYIPSFDTCPAGKSEFVFDGTGQIYGCTASCGREGYELGTFYPKLTWNEAALKEWQTRNILNIPECVNCSVGVVCGGGCGVIANDRTGKIHSPNCKPIKEVMDIGIHYYKDYFLGNETTSK